MVNIQVPAMIPLEELKKRRKADIVTGIGKTIRSMKNTPSGNENRKKSQPYKLLAVDGAFAGAIFPLDSEIVLGRSVEGSDIVYDNDTPGISRKHCSIRPTEDGQVLIKDLGSTSGTFFTDGVKLSPNVSYRIQRGECFYLATKRETYKIM
ncbi:MAG: FHA domain-containing protein [Lachnospiraceae bacterium]|nr:FHA domain-containing protein [Lachnospiraceae bacterium]